MNSKFVSGMRRLGAEVVLAVIGAVDGEHHDLAVGQVRGGQLGVPEQADVMTDLLGHRRGEALAVERELAGEQGPLLDGRG